MQFEINFSRKEKKKKKKKQRYQIRKQVKALFKFLNLSRCQYEAFPRIYFPQGAVTDHETLVAVKLHQFSFTGNDMSQCL